MKFHFFPKTLSARIILLIIFILCANAAITSLFSLNYLKKIREKEEIQLIHIILNHFETTDSMEGFSDILKNYNVHVIDYPQAELSIKLDRLLYDIQSRFNKNEHEKIYFYTEEEPSSTLYIHYFSLKNDTSIWLKMNYDPVKKEDTLIYLTEEFIIFLILIIGSYLTTQTVRRPLNKVKAALEEFGHGKIPEKIPLKGPYEVQQLSESFNHMIENYCQFQKERDLILAGISHDIRTPLTRLQLMTELSTLSSDLKKDFQDEIDQIIQMQQQFLDYVSVSKEKELMEEVNLHLYLSDIVHKYRHNFKEIYLHSNFPTLMINSQTTSLYRMLTNCINNAIKYGEPPVDVFLEIDSDNRTIIRIVDHGPGVPESSLTDIFKPLYRGDWSRKNADGSGLGLAIVTRIAEKLSCQIEASNLKPRGFQIKIIFLKPQLWVTEAQI